ncbi:MAG: response regulator [Acidobacteria bacterium]|nr:response regulator [Acidobacteriota bacterium]
MTVISEKTVLVVEDEEDIRFLLKAVLESEGYQVTEATTGKDAVRIAAEAAPELILMDISLPLLDGLSATRQIRAEEALREVPIIAVSAYHTARRRAIRAGCSDLIGKPIDVEELKAAVRQAIGQA